MRDGAGVRGRIVKGGSVVIVMYSGLPGAGRVVRRGGVRYESSRQG